MKNNHITITDQFCGAGGSSQGVRKYAEKIGGGVEVKLAMNHWKLAVETHNTNFPDTLHDCADISASDPRRYPSTHGLITSPECTTHSPAGGNRHKKASKQMDIFTIGESCEETERSRATMWDVVRFTEYHKYEFVIVENVVEAKLNWPLFDDWLRAMGTIGYNHKCLYLNSKHFPPTPQSRDRMYIVFWKKGNLAPDLDYKPIAYCFQCCKNVESIQTWKNPLKKFGKYNQSYIYSCSHCNNRVEPYYYASMNIIDWSIPGKKIGDRSKPLSPKTKIRIKYGLDKYKNQSFIINNQHSCNIKYQTKSLQDHLSTIMTSPNLGLISPSFIVNNQHSSGIDCRVRSTTEQLQTIATSNSMSLLTMPFIIKLEHSFGINTIEESLKTITGRHSQMVVSKHSLENLPTQTTSQNMAIVNPGFTIQMKGTSKAKSLLDPLGGITTVNYQGIITNEKLNSFFTQYHGKPTQNHITESANTISTVLGTGLVEYNDSIEVEDCFYRMLTNHEIKLGMAFDEDYIILGNQRQQVKQCGNAVTPPVMEWLTAKCVESLN